MCEKDTHYTSKKRIHFCDDLRGLASLLVMMAHFIVGFESLQGYLYNPINTGVYPEWFLNMLPSFFDGALGVSLFFLISGFVIPNAVMSKGSKTFLIARVIRIYPTMIVSLLITLCIVFFMSSNSIISNILAYLKNVSLFRGWIGGENLNSVLWTLEVEVRFYLYIACAIYLLRSYPIVYFMIPLLMVSLSLWFGAQPHYSFPGMVLSLQGVSESLCYDFGYISFINIGVLIYLHSIKALKIQIIFFILCLSIVIVSLFLYVRYQHNLLVIKIYISSIVIFMAFYKYRWHFRGGLSTFFSKISYPLYLCHPSIGYPLLSILIFKYNIYPLFSLLLTVGATLSVAWLIHKHIEYPTMLLSSNFKGIYKKYNQVAY